MKKLLVIVLQSFVAAFASIAMADESFFLKKFQAKEGEVNPSMIRDVIEDKRGIIYVADATGVLEYDGIQWRKIVMPEAKGALALAADQNGRVYVAGPGEIGFLSPDKNGQMEFKSLSDQLTAEQKQGLDSFVQIQSLGLAMAFITDRQIYIWENNLLKAFSSVGDIQSSIGLLDQLLISDGKQGLVHWQAGSLKSVEGAKFFAAAALTSSEDQKIFGASMSDGLIELSWDGKQAQFKSLPKQDKTALMGASITRIRLLQDKIFVATIGKGLQVFLRSTGQPLALPEKVKKDLGNDITSLAIDREQRIWVGTMQGVFVITDRAQTEQVQKDTEQKHDFFAYVRSCVSMKDQAVIFGGAFFRELGGVQTLEASNLNKPELPFDQNALRFGYASSDLVNGDAVEYQSFLVGYDSEWTEWSNRTYREFTNLVWKKYVFQVRARQPNGTMSPVAKFELKIMPPWYERHWFYFLQLCILLALMAFTTYLKGWTKRHTTTEKLNGVVVGTIWGYTFSKVGVQGVIWAMSGGAAFLAIIANAFMGIFLKPLQKKLEARIIHIEERLIHRYKGTEDQETAEVQAKILALQQKARLRGKDRSPKSRLRQNKPTDIDVQKQRRVLVAAAKAESDYKNLLKSMSYC